MIGPSTTKSVSTPLPAIVGRDGLKRALLALATDDGLGGALVRGEKGTAKSTAVRALADLLPEQRVVADCPFGCPPPAEADRVPADPCESCRDRDDPPVEARPTPLVTLPLGATRDRVVGTLSVEDALAGEAEFEPGLLARANRGLLYVDEVNLLEDHLVDVLLDAAAAGRNRVERDGVSVTHPAEFALVGTMNPEEGELRPQLRDRFDLCVEVTGTDDLDERVAVLERAVDDGDPRAEFAAETAAMRERLAQARERDPAIPEEFKREIAELCRDAGVEGHRADIATARAARAVAALEDRPKVIGSDVREAAELALAHRLRSRPFEDAPETDDLLEDRFENDAGGSDDPEGASDSTGDDGGNGFDDGADAPSEEGESSRGGDGTLGDERPGAERGEPASDEAEPGESPERDADEGRSDGEPDPQAADASQSPPRDGGGEGEPSGDDDHADADPDGDDDEAAPIVPGAAGAARADPGEATTPNVEPPESPGAAAGAESGRAEAAPSTEGRGPVVRTEPAEGSGAVDAAATVREAAKSGRDHPTEADLRQSMRTTEARTLTVFVADASASMAPAMRAAKGVALELLKDAYAERDEVALVAVGGDDATTLLPPTGSVSLAARHLKDLPTADRTPLPAGLDAAAELLAREEPDGALVVVVSDGRANVADGSPTAATREAARRLGATDASVLVVEAGDSRAGLLDVVCEATDARRVPLDALSPETVVGDY